MPQINIKTLDGQKKPFQVEETDTVAKLKETLAEKVRASRPLSFRACSCPVPGATRWRQHRFRAPQTGIYKEMIRLIFHGSPMVDEKTLVSSSSSARAGPAFPCLTHARAGRAQGQGR
jgi:hypothetical protein